MAILTSCNQADKNLSHMRKGNMLKRKDTIVRVNKSKQDTLVAFSQLESKMIDTIFQLKEVKDREEYIEQQTKGARHLQIWIAAKPTATNSYYWVKVGEDNGTNFVTHYNFHVYPKAMRILFIDMQEDQEIPLNVWREVKITK